MVARLEVVREEVTPEDWVQQADDDVLACRGQSHHFPRLRRGRGGRVPKGIRVNPPVDGVYVIEATCPDCQTVRIMETMPSGEIATPNRYRYIYPPNYKPPKGVRVPPRVAYAESWRRVREDQDVLARSIEQSA